ncbi:MAG: methyltransferase RsmF C-terminal domain-like protein [Blautia sp.]
MLSHRQTSLPSGACSLATDSTWRSKENRFEPSQPLALSWGKMVTPPASLVARRPKADPLSTRGDGLRLPETASPKGWQLVCVGNYPIGWGKLVNQTLKNKYPPGWRI